jgi:hypothetical protein
MVHDPADTALSLKGWQAEHALRLGSIQRTLYVLVILALFVGLQCTVIVWKLTSLLALVPIRH